MVIVEYELSVLEYQASDFKAPLIILKISINKERSLLLYLQINRLNEYMHAEKLLSRMGSDR
jgi:hypothetical protein